MFNRLFASIGIGSAKIDTLLEKNRYMPGEIVKGIVKVKGGNVEQRIETITLSVMTEYIRETNDHKVKNHSEIVRYRVSDPFSLSADELREVPFLFQLPYKTPVTVGQTPVWVKTGLDISGGVDSGDNDRIEIGLTPGMETIFNAMKVLGFMFRKAECEYASRLGGNLPFVQEFEFVPTTQFRGHLDEVEVMFFPAENELEIVLQIDRKARGFSSMFAEAMNLDESFIRVRFTNQQLSAGYNAVAKQLSDIISRHI